MTHITIPYFIICGKRDLYYIVLYCVWNS